MVLDIGPDPSVLARAGAALLLALHIGGGVVSMFAGAGALAFRKGSRRHAWAGTLFVLAMFAMAGVGAVVACFMPDRGSRVAGFMTLYLVVTGWLAVKRPAGQIGAFEWVSPLIPIGVAAAGAWFIHLASLDPSGTIDHQPPQSFYLYLIIGTLCTLGDVHLVLRRGYTGAMRIARHLWRMTFALWVSVGSLFLGQQQVFPAALRGSSLLFVPVILVLVLLVFWLLRVALSSKYRAHTAPPRSAAGDASPASGAARAAASA